MERFVSPRFPRTAKYHPDWIASSVSGGANSLWLTEWLTEAVPLQPGMRVLDLGCGRGASSVFLRREFGVEVWGTDLWFSVDERSRRFRDADVGERVFAIHADARSLPFAAEFFDAIISIDSFFYYGTDNLYLSYLARFVKPGGPIAIAGAGLMQEMPAEMPEHLRTWWTPDMNCLHSAQWWQQHWERSGLVRVELADTLEDGWRYWLDWHRVICPDNTVEIAAVEEDAGRFIGYVRAICRRGEVVEVPAQITSIPAEEYKCQPLLK